MADDTFESLAASLFPSMQPGADSNLSNSQLNGVVGAPPKAPTPIPNAKGDDIFAKAAQAEATAMNLYPSMRGDETEQAIREGVEKGGQPQQPAEAAPALTTEDMSGIFEERGVNELPVSGEFGEWATEKGLDAEDVNTLITYQQQAYEQALETRDEAWADEVHETFEPAEIESATEYFSSALTPELQQVIIQSGLASNPHVVRALAYLASIGAY